MANDEREQETKEQRRRAEEGAEIPRGTDEHSDEGRDRGDRGAADRDPRGVDLAGPLGGERREPGR